MLLVDADEQHSAADFAEQREALHPNRVQFTCVRLAGASVRPEIRKLSPKYSDIIVDTGGRDTTSQRAALTVADMLLLPFAPGSFDLWTVRQVSTLITEMRAASDFEAVAFLNRAEHRGADNAEALALLREEQTFQTLDEVIGVRKAFKTAAGEGLSVAEIRPGDPKAKVELDALYRRLYAVEMTAA